MDNHVREPDGGHWGLIFAVVVLSVVVVVLVTLVSTQASLNMGGSWGHSMPVWIPKDTDVTVQQGSGENVVRFHDSEPLDRVKFYEVQALCRRASGVEVMSSQRVLPRLEFGPTSHSVVFTTEPSSVCPEFGVRLVVHDSDGSAHATGFVTSK